MVVVMAPLWVVIPMLAIGRFIAHKVSAQIARLDSWVPGWSVTHRVAWALVALAAAVALIVAWSSVFAHSTNAAHSEEDVPEMND